MTKFINKFLKDEDGAVTVDWVVLTAAIVALGLAVGNAVATGAQDLANSVGADLTAQANGAEGEGEGEAEAG